MIITRLRISTAHLIFTCIFIALPVGADTKQVSGWVEQVTVDNPEFVLRAKIDTGARHSSMHAKDYRIFSKQGKDWVSFRIENKKGDTQIIEKPIKRITNIKQKGGRPSRERPVIVLGICLGNVYKEEEVNLADRANFNYPMLIGRSFLAGSFVVESEVEFVTSPTCKF